MTAGQALRQARIDAGMTLDDVAYESRRLLPRVMWITKTKLSGIENGKTPEEKLEPHLVEFLCHLYGVEVESISVLISGELKAYRRALKSARSRCVFEVTQPTLPWDASTELPDYALDIMIDLTGDECAVRPMAFAS